MKEGELIELFSGVVGSENVLVGEIELASYSYDASNIRGYPDIVVRPSSSDEVIEIMKMANETGTPVTPRGSGTSIVGGAVPIKGGIVIDLLKMNHIIEIDEDNLLATVETGVTVSELNKALTNSFYPIDPEVKGLSTIGGVLSEDSACPLSGVYGTARDNVLEIEVVLPNGEVFHLGKKSPSKERHLMDLIIGSEGTLGIITKATLKLKSRPEERYAFFVKMSDSSDAVSIVQEAEKSGIRISAFQSLYRDALREIGEEVGTDYIDFIGLIELSGDPLWLSTWIPKLREIINKLDPIEVEEVEGEEVKEYWRRVSVVYDIMRKKGMAGLSISFSIHKDKIRDSLQKVDQASMRLNLPAVTTFHPTLGWIIATFLFDPGKKKESERAEKAVSFVGEEVSRLGGSIGFGTGIGVSMIKQYVKSSPDAVKLLEFLKRTIDPKNIMNPGKLIPLRER
ncbi:MAG: hypothetical protein DRO05_01190 [Thermoproteota archaeon]|nr:MAG: hypothetical protein DRO05_01190 [Candidatus Korarchaeota archaeon]